ncbi:MAG: hypothetical protein CBD68_04305 [Flavobacteriaceae bacterium TMED208]|nr:MAG: hypothetical protein CBD68_04305 [Flavobacteriaceae bacterium TMED208]
MFFIKTLTDISFIKLILTLDLRLATAAIESPVPVEPLSPNELKEMLSKAKESEDDDCLMCGS